MASAVLQKSQHVHMAAPSALVDDLSVPTEWNQTPGLAFKLENISFENTWMGKAIFLKKKKCSGLLLMMFQEYQYEAVNIWVDSTILDYVSPHALKKISYDFCLKRAQFWVLCAGRVSTSPGLVLTQQRLLSCWSASRMRDCCLLFSMGSLIIYPPAMTRSVLIKQDIRQLHSLSALC